ncbi:D-alanine--D-alanine ligase [Candidatus Kaiserbacteria bacterium]|nr:D-alanine--D-alanine ligase [Candidatus Kaiserbacteria bacterium]USN92077.1 MAG: D-alanine--D-alanine ligase [Candidatus Nomurabacteria bacterium]
MKRVAVLRGGPSEQYETSMETGNVVLNALKQRDYTCKDIVVTKKGEWLDGGFVKSPGDALKAVDTVFVALHGQYGEDGKVQKILENEEIPFTGSRALPSAIAFNKDLTKRIIKSHGVKTPQYRLVKRGEEDSIENEIPSILAELGSELFIKPVAGGSSIGASYVRNDEILFNSLKELLQQYKQVMVEEFIRGREATVGVVSNFRNEDLYILPAVEIVPPKSDVFYSNENKQNALSDQICPGRFSYHEKARLAEISETVHKAIGCRHYSRSDFIIRNGEVYFLEINTLPAFTDNSNFPKASRAIGLDFPDLIQHLVENAHF